MPTQANRIKKESLMTQSKPEYETNCRLWLMVSGK